MEENVKKNNPEKNRDEEKKRGKKHLGWIVPLCIIVLVIAGLGVYSATYSEVMPNVSVGGARIGGMTLDDATEEIKAHLGDFPEDREILFRCEENSETIMLSDIGTEFDVAGSARVAFEVGREGGVFGKMLSMAKSVFEKKEIPVCVKVDESKFESLIERLAGEFETPMIETRYELEGNELTIIKGEPGEMVDREKALGYIAEAVQKPEISEIELVVEKSKPHEVDIDEFYEEMSREPQNAEYRLEDGEVIVVPHHSQVKVEKGKIADALASQEKRYSLTVDVTPADVTKEDLEELLFRDVLGTYTSNFSTSSSSRASNVCLTAERINGYILMPGDEFSYDKTVGKRTIANGYKEAGVFVGNKKETGIGGGICQTSSTLYSAALYSDIEIVRRTSHSLPVGYVPAGQDATIAQGYIDLVLKNNTEYPVKIVATISGRNITCSFLGVKDPDKTVEIVHSSFRPTEPEVERTENPDIPQGYKKIVEKGAPGFSVASKRIVKVKGEVVREEKLTNSVYHPMNIVEEVNPADKDVPWENLRIYDEAAYKKEQEELAKAEESAEQESVPTSAPETEVEEEQTAEITIE